VLAEFLTPPQNGRLLLPALARAIQALTLVTDCMNLFGNEETRQGRFNPTNVLTSIVRGGEFGQVKFEN
jgi:hypothetical protein